MTALEQRDRTPLEPRVEKVLWLFENAGAPEPIRQYVRDKLAAFYLTLGGDPQTTTPKKLMKNAHGILNEVIDAAKGDDSLDPRLVLAAQYSLKGERSMTSIALDDTKGNLVRGINAMARLTDLRDNEFKERPHGEKSFFIDAALLVLVHEILDRDKKGEIALDEPHEIISLDVQAPAKGMIDLFPPKTTADSALKPSGILRPDPTVTLPASERALPLVKERRKVRKDQLSIGPNFGNRVRDLRNAFQIPLIDLLGRNRADNLRLIESGARTAISVELARELAERFGITLADLFNSELSIKEIMSRKPISNPIPQEMTTRKKRRTFNWGEVISGLTDDDKKRIGRNIRRIRIDKAISQKEFFEDDSGQGRQSRLERGIFPITSAIIEREASRLGVSVEKIMGAEVEIPPKAVSIMSEPARQAPRKKSKDERTKPPLADAMELKADALMFMEKRKSGEFFILAYNGEEYSLLQDGTVRARSKRGIKTWKFDDALSLVGYDTFMPAFQRAVAKIRPN